MPRRSRSNDLPSPDDIPSPDDFDSSRDYACHGQVPFRLIKSAHDLIFDKDSDIHSPLYSELRLLLASMLNKGWKDDEISGELRLSSFDLTALMSKCPGTFWTDERASLLGHVARRRARVLSREDASSDLPVLALQDRDYSPKVVPLVANINYVMPPEEREKLLSKFPSLIDAPSD